MSRTQLTGLSQRITRSDPNDIQQQSEILFELRNARKTLHESPVEDLGACLEAAATLTQYLPEVDGSVSKEIQRIVLRLVKLVADGVEAEESPAPGAPQGGELKLISDMLLGEIMLHMGRIGPEDIVRALQTQRRAGLRFGEALIANGAVLPQDVEEALYFQKCLSEATVLQPDGLEPDREVRAPQPRADLDSQAVQNRMRGHKKLRMSGQPKDLHLAGESKSSTPEDLSALNDMFLGEVLIRLGCIDRDQLQRGLQLQRASGTRLGEALVETGATNWDEIREGVRIQSLHRDQPPTGQAV